MIAKFSVQSVAFENFGIFRGNFVTEKAIKVIILVYRGHRLFGDLPKKKMEFYASLLLLFHSIYIQKFSNIFEIWSLVSEQNFEKTYQKSPENFEIFQHSLKLRIYSLVSKLVQNDHID